METYMEKLVKVKEKEAKFSTIPLDVIPIVVIPTATPTTTGTSGGVEYLAKAMEKMTIQKT